MIIRTIIRHKEVVFILKYEYNKLNGKFTTSITKLFGDDKAGEWTDVQIDISINANPKMPAVFTAELGDCIVALLYIFAPTLAEIEVHAFVRSDMRRQGIFKSLLKEAIEECAEFGYKKGLFVINAGSNAEGVINHWGCPVHHTEIKMQYAIENAYTVSGEIQLAKATIEDLDELVGLSSLIFDVEKDAEINMLKTSILDKERLLWVLKKDGKSIGLCGAAEKKDGLMIYGLGIHPDERRKGYARALLHHATNEAKACGYHKLYLEVDGNNYGAKALYKAFGFKVRRVICYYSFGFDQIQKRL